MTVTAIIKTAGLTYHFNKQQTTPDNINLCVEKGSIYGFLGPNGAGKRKKVDVHHPLAQSKIF